MRELLMIPMVNSSLLKTNLCKRYLLTFKILDLIVMSSASY
jgi:hypothetical protein